MNTVSVEPGVAGGGREAAFFATAALAFGISVAVTIHGSLTMPMPWMRMPGQTWPGAAGNFLGMWVAMMVAMMLPSLLPTLCRYRLALGRARVARREQLTAVVSAGYFCVWSMLGMAVYPLGIALAAIEARHPALARCAPMAAGVLVVVAGMLQFSAWKSRQLECCRGIRDHHHAVPSSDIGAAWRYGLQCGRHCGYCCAGPTMILLALGFMDLRTMALVMLAITAERLAPVGAAIARFTGGIAITAGLILIARA